MGLKRDTRLIFFRDDIDRINRVLDEFNALSGATCSILIDKEGHSVARVGAATNFNEETLASLVAGSFEATREMSRLLGEEAFSLLSHQGKRDHVQLTLIADRCILTTMFDERAKGDAVRLHGQEAARKLNAIFEEIAARPDPGTSGDDPDGTGVFARLRPRPMGPGGAHATPPPAPDAPEDPPPAPRG